MTDTAPARIPPHNFAAEMALLGAILCNNRAYDQVSDFLLPEHFADPRHGSIFRICGALITHGQRADPVTIKDFFEGPRQFGLEALDLSRLGGTEYLVKLATAGATPMNAPDYGRTIFDRWRRRQLIDWAEQAISDAHQVELDRDAGRIIESVEAGLHRLGIGNSPGKTAEPVNRIVKRVIEDADAAMRSGKRTKGVLTGLAPIDAKLRGLRPGQLVVLAGATSSGKTALACNIAFNAAQPRLDEGADKPSPGHRIAFFSLEMSSEEVATNFLTRQTGLASNDIDSGNIEIVDFSRLMEAAQKMEALPLHIDDTAPTFVSTIRSKCRRLKPELIVIDYLQLIRAAAPDATFWNDVSRLEQISGELKVLAKEMACPVIVLCQFSRETAKRESHRPLLSDIRGSGSIENDADIVMLIYREEYWLERSKPEKEKELLEWQARLDACRNKTEIIIAKGRRFATGSIFLHYEPARCRFGTWPAPDANAAQAFAYQEQMSI